MKAWIRKYWVMIFIDLSILVLFFILLHYQKYPDDQRKIDNSDSTALKTDYYDSILKPETRYDLSGLSKTKINEHNNTLLNTQQSLQALSFSWLASLESQRNQARTLLFAIFIFIITSVIKTKSNKNQPLLWVLFFLIPMLYYLDVHFEDIYRRNYNIKVGIDASVLKLIEMNPNDTTFWVYDHLMLKKQFQDASLTPERWKRKLHSAFRPNMEQCIYYIFPWGFIFLMIHYNIFKKKKKGEKPLDLISFRQYRMTARRRWGMTKPPY
jgi:hypothetical protein